MSTGTRTGTKTTTITAGDVRKVMAATTEEITTLCTRAGAVARDFNVDDALRDCSLFALNDIISAIRLQFYLGDELVREYAYVIAPSALTPEGPPPGQPPAGAIPPGARVRLVVSHNLATAREIRDGWFKRLGWGQCRPLQRPAGVQPQTYGTFASGGFGVERQLLVNPKYDQPVTDPDHATPQGKR